MSQKTIKKEKGHRSDEVEYFIPFYSKDFFEPNKKKDEDEEDETKPETVLVPVKIDKNGGDNRANVTNLKMKAISHFENNIENVLTSFSQIATRYMLPMGIKDEKVKLKSWIQMLLLICPNEQAAQTIHACQTKARQYVWDSHIYGADKDDKVLHDIFVADDTTMEAHWRKTTHDFSHPFLSSRKCTSQKQFNDKMFEDYKRAF